MRMKIPRKYPDSHIDLQLGALRTANLERLPQFKNAKGQPAHSKPDGSDWSLSDWTTALAGEVGEAANLIKKVRRGDCTLDEIRHEIAEELADVLTYLDILAFQAGINLAGATILKFNKVSERVDSTVFIDKTDGEPYTDDDPYK